MQYHAVIHILATQHSQHVTRERFAKRHLKILYMYDTLYALFTK